MHPSFFNIEPISFADKANCRGRSVAAGMFLDLRKHGDVAVLETSVVEVMFLSGVPAAFYDKRRKVLCVSSDLKVGDLGWHRQQVADYWRGERFEWTPQAAVFGALLTQPCLRPHNPPCERPHFNRCTRPHLSQPRPERRKLTT